MDHATRPVANPNDDGRGSRTHRWSDSNALAYPYPLRAGDTVATTPDYVQSNVHSRDPNSPSGQHLSKRPRVDSTQNRLEQHGHGNGSRHSTAVVSSAFLPPAPAPAIKPEPSPRYVDSATTAPGAHRMPLDTLQQYSAASDGLPIHWGPLSRSHRDSSASVSTQPVSLPAISADLNVPRSSYNAGFHGHASSSYLRFPGSVHNGTPISVNTNTVLPSLPLTPTHLLSTPSRTTNHGTATQASTFPPAYPSSHNMNMQTLPPTAFHNNNYQIAGQSSAHSETASSHATQVAVSHTADGLMLKPQHQEGGAVATVNQWGDYIPSAQMPASSVAASRAALHHIVNPADSGPPLGELALVRSSAQIDRSSDRTVVAAQRRQVGLPVARRPRSSFTQDQRKETSQTRAHGACLRCKSQRIRCVPSVDGPLGMCKTCEQVARGSKKVFHVILCYRWRLTEMSIHRQGGLNLTDRWTGTHIRDVGDWAASEIHEIEMKLFYSSESHKYDLCDVPVKLRVRRFRPNRTDVLNRKWSKSKVDDQGVVMLERRYVQLPPFALADVNETCDTLRDYFNRNTLRAVANVARHSDPVIADHLHAAVKHYCSLPDGDVEKKFLEKFFRLWFYIRYTTGSAYISGADTLGCGPVNDPDYPLGDRISVPRMITAQCDSIMVTRFLRPLASNVLGEFEKFFLKGNPSHWFLLYVCTFVLLQEVSFSSLDRRRHAIENWMTDTPYTVYDFVRALQFGANIVLTFWHYYRTMDPTDNGWDIFCQIVVVSDRPRSKIESAKGKGKKKVHVTEEQRKLLMAHWQNMIQAADDFKHVAVKQYEHPLYFVSQMYVKNWSVMETYRYSE